MKLVFTDDALHDLDEILQYTSANYPGVYSPFEKRLRTMFIIVRAMTSARTMTSAPGNGLCLRTLPNGSA